MPEGYELKQLDARGLWWAWVNGGQVGPDRLSPGPAVFDAWVYAKSAELAERDGEAPWYHAGMQFSDPHWFAFTMSKRVKDVVETINYGREDITLRLQATVDGRPLWTDGVLQRYALFVAPAEVVATALGNMRGELMLASAELAARDSAGT